MTDAKRPPRICLAASGGGHVRQILDLKPLIQLRAQGYDVLVVSPNPVKYELSYLPSANANVELAGRVLHMERFVLLQKLQRASIHVVDWDVKEPFDLVVKRNMGRSPAWLRAIGR